MNKRNIVESCYRLGCATPHFFDRSVVGITFDSKGTPILLVHKRGDVSLKLLEKCEGKRIHVLKVPILKGNEEGDVILH